jgi:hypothetical protein
MHRFPLALLLAFATSIAWGQPWSAYFDLNNSSDRVHGLTADSHGNVYVTMDSNGPGGQADQTVVYTATGAVAWSDRWLNATGDRETPAAMTLDSMGNLWIVGESEPNNTSNSVTYLLRYSPGGGAPAVGFFDVSSDREEPSGIALDSNNDVYVCGTSDGTQRKAYIVKFDHLTLTQVWNKTYSFATDDGAQGITADGAGHTFTLGFSHSSTGAGRAFLLKHDKDGNVIWKYFYAPPSGSTGLSVYRLVMDAATNCYWCGGLHSNSTKSDALVQKVDVHGLAVWTAVYDGPFHGYDGINNLALDPDGNVFAVGQSDVSSTSTAILTLKINPQGTILAHPTTSLTPNDDESAVDLSIDKAHRIYVLGSGNLFAGANGQDLVVVEYDTRTMALKRLSNFGGGFGSYEPGQIVSQGNGHVNFTGGSFGVSQDVVTVQGVEPPISNDDTYLINYGHSLYVDPAHGLLANDLYAGTAQLQTSPTKLSDSFFAFDGSMSLTPKPGAFGADSFTYKGSRDNFLGNLATVHLNIVPALASLSMNPNTIAKGGTSTGTITLNHVSGPGGTTVALKSSNPSVLTVPSTVVVPSGQSTATFTATAHALAANATVAASWNGITKTATVTVQ